MTIEFNAIESAAERIEGLVHRTPVMTSVQIDELTGAELYFKCENLQKVGAFKARGAVNAVFSLATLNQGVATHSSGNHGAALAMAAKLKKTDAYIVVPNDAKQAKQDAIRGYGGEVIPCEPNLEAREAKLAEVLERTGATFIHPYNDPSIIAGQGTAVLELVDQVSNLELIVTPVGGGGLLAGGSIVAARHKIAIFGAEPEGAADAHRSIATGDLVTSHVPDTICDGLLTTLGRLNFDIIRDKISGILLVSDNQVIDAMALIWSRLKMVVEPSSAVTLAAVIRNPDLFAGKKVGLILTGGNVDLASLPF
jgi:threonine dehydratase